MCVCVTRCLFRHAFTACRHPMLNAFQLALFIEHIRERTRVARVSVYAPKRRRKKKNTNRKRVYTIKIQNKPQPPVFLLLMFSEITCTHTKTIANTLCLYCSFLWFVFLYLPISCVRNLCCWVMKPHHSQCYSKCLRYSHVCELQHRRNALCTAVQLTMVLFPIPGNPGIM